MRCAKVLLLLITLLIGAKSFAETMAFDEQEFIDIASIRTISEIETAKVALSRAQSVSVKHFAQSMIDENAELLSQLRNIAGQQDYLMLSETELKMKARKYVFMRKGQSFDVAYADRRFIERRKTVSLYRQAAQSASAPLRSYAQQELPKLMQQLYLAQSLAANVSSNSESLVVNLN